VKKAESGEERLKSILGRHAATFHYGEAPKERVLKVGELETGEKAIKTNARAAIPE